MRYFDIEYAADRTINHLIIASRKLNINPDNVATPIAASLGDLVTLAILAQSAKILYNVNNSEGALFIIYKAELLYPIIILAVYAFAVIPFCLQMAKICESTKDLLMNGWTPVLSAMVISSLGGTILNKTINSFPKIGNFLQ